MSDIMQLIKSCPCDLERWVGWGMASSKLESLRVHRSVPNAH